VKVAPAFETLSILLSLYNRSSRVEQAIVQTIFKPFFTKKKGGRGIGLFIAMRNVKIHGGNINVTSGDNGTIFTITLPVAK